MGSHTLSTHLPSRRPPGRRRLRLLAAVVTVLGCLAGVMALGLWLWLRVPPTDASPEEAIALFDEVMNGATQQRPQALSALAGAVSREPENGRVRLYFGLANLHGFLQHRELPYAIRASRALTRAVELMPHDPSAEGWRAFFAYQAAESRGDDLREPTRVLLAAAAADPSFTSFLAAVALAEQPLESGLPQQTLAPLEAAGRCPDGTTYGCRTGSLFPHGAEGYHATLGDLRIRLGDLAGGRESYARALEMPAADTWPYRGEFLRWVEGAAARAEAFGDANSNNDPSAVFFATGARACATCHER